MPESTVAHNTFVIERSYPSNPQRVFAAFSDKTKKRRWMVEGEGFTVESFEMDFRNGGQEQSTFRYQGGPLITMDAQYQNIVPNERIVFVYSMKIGDQPLSSSLTTIEFFARDGRTNLLFTEQGVFYDGKDSIAGREEGSRLLLEELAKELDKHA